MHKYFYVWPYIIAILTLFAAYYLSLYFPLSFVDQTLENSFTDWLTFFCLITAVILLGIASKQTPPKNRYWLVIIISLVMFFAMEEINWGENFLGAFFPKIINYESLHDYKSGGKLFFAFAMSVGSYILFAGYFLLCIYRVIALPYPPLIFLGSAILIRWFPWIYFAKDSLTQLLISFFINFLAFEYYVTIRKTKRPTLLHISLFIIIIALSLLSETYFKNNFYWETHLKRETYVYRLKLFIKKDTERALRLYQQMSKRNILIDDEVKLGMALAYLSNKQPANAEQILLPLLAAHQANNRVITPKELCFRAIMHSYIYGPNNAITKKELQQVIDMPVQDVSVESTLWRVYALYLSQNYREAHILIEPYLKPPHLNLKAAPLFSYMVTYPAVSNFYGNLHYFFDITPYQIDMQQQRRSKAF